MVAPAAGNRLKLANGKDHQPWGYLKVTHTVQSRNLRVNRNLMDARKPWINARTQIVRISSFRCSNRARIQRRGEESRAKNIFLVRNFYYSKRGRNERAVTIINCIESSSLDNKNSLNFS